MSPAAPSPNQFRRLLRRHRTLFFEHLLQGHSSWLIQHLARDASPRPSLCRACGHLADLELSRRAFHQSTSAQALVAYWGRKLGAALAEAMLTANPAACPRSAARARSHCPVTKPRRHTC